MIRAAKLYAVDGLYPTDDDDDDGAATAKKCQ
jgi:hypothetical protein